MKRNYVVQSGRERWRSTMKIDKAMGKPRLWRRRNYEKAGHLLSRDAMKREGKKEWKQIHVVLERDHHRQGSLCGMAPFWQFLFSSSSFVAFNIGLIFLTQFSRSQLITMSYMAIRCAEVNAAGKQVSSFLRIFTDMVVRATIREK